jgi:dTDP-4-dehydrorhamnose 3,5-epimerase
VVAAGVGFGTKGRNVPIEIRSTAIPEVKLILPLRITDSRGFFSEVYRHDEFVAAGLPIKFVQENQSLSIEANTVRGLHYQAHPFAQGKLIRVLRGRIFDVAVDLRASSPTYGKHVSAELSAENWQQMFMPVGFAHGFCTLESNTEVVYKVTCYYSHAHDFGVAWNDPDIGIDWPVLAPKAILSEKDKNQPRLAEVGPIFD